MRSVESLPDYIRQKIDQRRYWNKQNRPANNVLEQFFPSFQFSYATPLPQAYRKGYVDLVVSGKGKARVTDIARSHSIWLDPVDAPKELYKYRLRIQRVIKWAYKQGYVPIMMTLTIYHRWHHLDELLAVLREAWKDLFSNYAGRKRVADVDLQGWVRRLEITINDAEENSKSNAGFHPHFHAIIMVPKDKLQHLSDVEQEWRDAWVASVCKHFEKTFGEKIDESFLPAFREHGLVFSRYQSGPFKGQLRPVSDGSYLAKIMGYDNAHVFGGDSEMTDSTLKDSKIPFDLLLEVTASNVDLFCEYAIATKGVAALTFSKGLQDKVDKYLEHFPHKRASSKCPAEKLVATIKREVYQLIQRNSLYPMLLKKVSEGYEALRSWLNQVYVDFGVPELCDCPFAQPRPPT